MKWSLLLDIEHELEITNFNDTNDCDDSYQYIVSLIEKLDDDELVKALFYILDDTEKYPSLSDAYRALIEYLDD